MSWIAGLKARLLADHPVPLSPEVSIGMAAHGNSRTTRVALKTLFASASGDFELILVDDCSPDDTLSVFREAREAHRNTALLAFPENREYCHSVNAFLSLAKGRRLLFVSNDIFVNPSYLRQLLLAADSISDCGILRGCSNYVDNDSPLHNVPFEGEPTRAALFEHAAAIAASGVAQLVDDRYLVGDAFLVSRAVLDRIGTFDTRFPGYCGDADFGLRAQIAGLRLALAPRAFAYHQEHANITYLPPEEQRRKLELRFQRASQALRLLLEKYGVAAQGIPIGEIPWERLAKQPFDPARHYVAPLDYSRYLVA